MTLISVIKSNKNMRRIFGKRELIIIEKQLLGVTLTPSEKTRLSRDIRKKFDAVATLIPFVQEFRLRHGDIIKEHIHEAKDVILKSTYFPRINKIVLFGSAVTHQLTLGSDIDIAVDFISVTKEEAFRFRLDVLKEVPDKIDVQVYNVLPMKIKKEIDAQGKILYERAHKR